MLELITFGDKILTQKSHLVKDIDEKIVKLVKEMFKTMYENRGIGLAAVQVGYLLKLFVIGIEDIGEFVMINPKILDVSLEKTKYEEGCLSIPGITGFVERPKEIFVEYTDLKGKTHKIEASGLLSICIQHEYDHTEGILFIDRLSPEERIEKIGKYRKIFST